ncbi:MAG: hypothetical protein UX16_C0004G0003 [Parcubacteria group bacterium GW2011_GWB1_45_7]|nr:MAG: hypothetical protein UX16_C0004G0003 [Parcubacteria group bacterium GW2011_GWB1_45_7]
MTNGKKPVYVVVTVIGAVVVLAGIVFFFNSRGTLQKLRTVQDPEKIALRDSEGLNIEYPEGFENGERVIFERYGLFDDTGQYKFIGPYGDINITSENAEVFLTHPDGTREEITSDLWYIPFRILPPLQEGTYTLTFNLKTGETYDRTIEVAKSEEVKLTPANLRKTQEKPVSKLGMLVTPEQSYLLNDFGIWDRKSRELTAFSLGGLGLKKATSIYYINPHDTVKSINTPGFEIDDYFWLDIFKMAEIERGEHIFLAKIDNTWYYDKANYPEDFE